jgi:hypothetical protein
VRESLISKVEHKMMNHSSKVLLIAPLTLLVSSSLAAADASQVVSQVKQLAVSTVESNINELANDAANSFGNGTTEISISNIESGNPSFSIKTIQPLTTLDKDAKSLIFTQGSVASGETNGDRRTTINLGLGKRVLVEDNKAIFGANAFYDYETESEHQRASLGVEYKRSNFSAAVNNYWALSDEVTIDNAKEQALSGYDVKLSGQVPYTPWATLKGTHYYWDQKSADDTTGYIVGVEVDLSSSAKFELGFENSSTMNKTAYGKLTFKLQPSGDYQPTNFSFDSTAFRAQEDMDITTLAMVERNNTIVRSVTSAGSETSVSFKGLTYNFVVSPDTGRVWLDRNLGATAVCADADSDGVAGAGDEACWGDYYQWGRAADGHEYGTSVTQYPQLAGISTGSTSFIVSNADWTSADATGANRQSGWGDGGANDICPTGYRVPTASELTADMFTAGIETVVTDEATAFSSFLKMPVAGLRHYMNGKVYGGAGYVWSATPHGTGATNMRYGGITNVEPSNARGHGFSVRCISDAASGG